MVWQKILSHGKLTLPLLVITIGFHMVMYFSAHYETKDWLKGAVLNEYTELPSAKLLNDPAAPAATWAARLQEQYDDVRRHSAMQLRVYIDMQDSYYASTMTWTVLAALASLLGVFLIKVGWEKADEYLVNAALTVTLLLTFWQAIPKMLSMSSNIASTKKSYLACVQLGNEMRSFAQQPHTPTDQNKSKEAVETEFMNKADKRLSEIRNLNFDIDVSQAPDYRKAIQDEMKAK